MEDKNDNKKSVAHKIFNIIGISVIIITIILFLFFLPDLIYNIRMLLLQIGILKKIAIPKLDGEKYISIMLTIISCCITGTMSFIAYRLSKTLGTIEMNGQNAKLSLLAIKLLRNIEYNSEIIFRMSRDIRDELSRLQCEDIFSEAVTRLYSSHVIDKYEKEICSDYLKLVEKICKIKEITEEKGEHDLNEQKLSKQIEKFCDNYFKDNSDILRYNDDFGAVIAKLELISNGGDINV